VPELRVIARTSSFSFKGKEVDIAEIARKLNVANILEGSVRKSGDTLRITAQLVRASDSSHLWSQTYDRHVTDIFNVQDEIARAVVEQLRIKLLGVAPKILATDPQAYALFLQGREVARQFSAASFEQAIDLYQQALAIDPGYAPAWDGLADTYFNQMDFTAIPFDQVLPLVREAIRQTLKIDAQYAPAYARLALVEGITELDLASGARHIERGLELDPANLEVISAAVFIAWYLQRFDQGIALGKYVISRDPVNELGHDRLALTYMIAGRLEEALEEFRIVLKLKPTFGGEHYFVGLILLLQGDAEAGLAEIQQEHMESWRLLGLVMAYYQLGRRAESDAALEEVINKYGKDLPSHVAYALTYRGEMDRAFELLEQADVRSLSAQMMARHAVLAPLHSDPRWLPFLQRTGMAPEQLAAIRFDVKVPK
jgi:tetratricopeptide (TPR) repeat protein